MISNRNLAAPEIYDQSHGYATLRYTIYDLVFPNKCMNLSAIHNHVPKSFLTLVTSRSEHSAHPPPLHGARKKIYLGF